MLLMTNCRSILMRIINALTVINVFKKACVQYEETLSAGSETVTLAL
jgi:hypothetical protein